MVAPDVQEIQGPSKVSKVGHVVVKYIRGPDCGVLVLSYCPIPVVRHRNGEASEKEAQEGMTVHRGVISRSALSEDV